MISYSLVSEGNVTALAKHRLAHVVQPILHLDFLITSAICLLKSYRKTCLGHSNKHNPCLIHIL